jgi:hypothetical protein
MGIHTEAVTGTGIKFYLKDEIETLKRIVQHFINTNEKREEYNQYYRGQEEYLILEMLEVFLPESLSIKFFGNSVCETRSNPQGVMLCDDVETITNIINDFNLNKQIGQLAEVYIG